MKKYHEDVQNQIDQIVLTLRNERKRKNITQAELAELIGSAAPNISRMESLNYVPSLATIIKVGQVLGYELQIKKICATKI